MKENQTIVGLMITGLIVFFSFSMGFASQLETITSTPIIELSSRIIKDVNGGVHGVEFLGKDKKVRLRYENENKHSTVSGLDHWSETDVEKRGNYFLITKSERQANPQSVYQSTGWEITESNHVYVYDVDGNVVFEKSGVPYRLIWISDNGKVLACFVDSPTRGEDINTYVDKAVKANPPHGGIYVYSVTGQILYKKSRDDISDTKTRLSPDGKWLAYTTSDPKSNVVIVDLAVGSEYQVPIGLHEFKFSEVGNDGSLYGHQRKFTDDKSYAIEKVLIYSLNRK